MKRNWKKSLSLAVSVSMALAPMTAFAEDGANDAENTTVATGEVLEDAEESGEEETVEEETTEEGTVEEAEAPAEQEIAMVAEAPAQTETKSVTDEAGLKSALEAAKPGDEITVTGNGFSLQGDIVIPEGVTVDIQASGVKLAGHKVTVNVDSVLKAGTGADAIVLIGDEDLQLTSGTAEVTVDDNTAGTTITLKGEAIAKDRAVYGKDKLVVAESGTLTFTGDCTSKGQIEVKQGANAVVEGTLELTRGADNNGSISNKEGGTLTVKKGATLDIEDYEIEGAVKTEAGAILKAGTDAIIGGQGLDITEGDAAITFGTDPETAVTLNGKATAGDEWGVWTDDALTIADGGELTIPDGTAFNVKGKMTVSENAKVTVENGGALNVCYTAAGAANPQGSLQMDGDVTIKNGGQLHVNNNGATGKVNIEAGAKVLATKTTADADDQIIGDKSLDITEGQATVKFEKPAGAAETKTEITIPADAKAEIKGSGIDTTQGADTGKYRLEENDTLNVEGKLTVKPDAGSTGMEVAGEVNVSKGGSMVVESGKLEVVDNGGGKTGSMAIDKDSAVTFGENTELKVPAGATNVITGEGKIYAHENATVSEDLKVEKIPADLTIKEVQVVDGTDGYTPVTEPKPGQKLNANILLSDDTMIGTYPRDARAHYKWYYEEGQDNILGTDPVYTVTSDNSGKTLCVEVTVDGFTGTYTWKAAGTVPGISEFVITATAETGGSITPSGAINVASGQDQTFTITANAGYYIADVLVDAQSVKAVSSYTFREVDANHTITAKFRRKSSYSGGGGGGGVTKHNISSASGIENGKVSMSPASAAKGSKVTITVTPDQGYAIDKVKVTDANGNKIDLKDEGNGKYTFTMPGSKVEVNATFVKATETEPEKPADKLPIVLTINQTAVSVFGKTQISDVAPLIRGSRTMLPIRLIAENLGARVTWNQAQKMVTITKDDLTIVIYIGQSAATVNGQSVQLDAPAFIENNRTYLPIRFVSENLGAEVTWDAEKQQVSIYPAD